MKIPAKHTQIVFAFFMSLMMAFIMSGVLTLANLGPIPGFFGKWMHGFGVAWICAFPTVLLVAPIARRLVAAVIETPVAPK